MDLDDIDAALDAIPLETWEPTPSHRRARTERRRAECEALFGLKAPTSALTAMATSAVIVRALTAPHADTRRLERAMVAVEAHERELGSGAKARFADVGTGMRMRYREYGGDDRVVLVLHDVGECGDVYCGIAKSLSERGYRAYTIDLRGHGETTWSREKRYSPSDLADDIESFIIELDLYVRPLTIVGIGMGGIVATMVENKNPRLVASTVLVECSPLAPIDAFAFHPLQAAAFEDAVGAVHALLSPSITTSDVDPERRNLKHVCLRALCTITRGSRRDDGAEALWRWRMDPEFYCEYDEDSVWRSIETVSCHFAVVYGEHSSRIDARDAELIVKAASMNAKSSRAYVVAGASRFVVEDAMADTRDMIMYALMRADDDMLVKNKQARTPELLGIRPLPQYATLEEAMKALAPRPVPTSAVVEEALRDARKDDECESDDDTHRFNNRTKLIQNDPEYFGFVG